MSETKRKRGNPGTPRPTAGRKSSYWRGTIGREAAAALSVMALQDAIQARIEQDEAAEQLVARLILEERDRRLASYGPLPTPAEIEASRARYEATEAAMTDDEE